MRQRLTETLGEGAHPLDIHGRRVIDCHEQLVGILRNRLGQNHADFFAQPAQTAGARSIVWYTSVPGEVVAVATLPPEDKQRLMQRAERILGDVEGLAAQTAPDGPAGATVAELLRAAAQVPPDALLFSVGGKVVGVLWGHRAATTPHALATPPQETRHADGRVHAPTPAAASDTVVRTHVVERAPAKRHVWVAPALLALLAIALLAWAWKSDLLFRLAGRGDDLSTQIVAAEARNQTLASRISDLKKKPAAVRCIPSAVPAPGKKPGA